jgi:hypothetical protein
MAADQVAVFGKPEGGPVQIECVNNLLLRSPDDAVYLLGWCVHGGGGEIGEEPLEPPQTVVGRGHRPAILDASRFSEIEHRSDHDDLLCDWN